MHTTSHARPHRATRLRHLVAGGEQHTVLIPRRRPGRGTDRRAALREQGW